MDTNTFVQNFNRAVSTGLPGEQAHALLMPVNRPFTSSILNSGIAYRDCGVGVILYPELNSIYCVLIKRQEYEGIHSAQISFPGGKMDKDDVDLEFTARRECFEEINFFQRKQKF